MLAVWTSSHEWYSCGFLRLCSGLALRLRYAQDDEFRGDVVFREVREAMGDQRSSRAAGFAKEWHGGGRAR